MSSHTLNYVNLGCGNRCHPDWINIDIAATGPNVRAYDLRCGIPLPDARCDVVYHSHPLEHFRRTDALRFMRECYRVPVPGGVLRVATPDLERICQLYLEKLQAACNGDVASAQDYAWIMLEMYDQTVREQTGGEMLNYLRQEPLPNSNFVYDRIGEEGRQLVETLRAGTSMPAQRRITGRWWTRWQNLPARLTGIWERFITQLVLGPTGRRALAVGRFRQSGEVHHWMYDGYSLAQLMLAAGFRDPVRQSAAESRIPGWSRFDLDTLSDGTVNKPDSLYMEAIKSV